MGRSTEYNKNFMTFI